MTPNPYPHRTGGDATGWTHTGRRDHEWGLLRPEYKRRSETEDAVERNVLPVWADGAPAVHVYIPE